MGKSLTKVKSLRQACRKLAAHYLVRQRNLETVCRSVPLVAHFRRTTDCAPQRARLCARTGIVCEKCATIYSYSKQALIVCQKCARGFSLYFYSVKVSRVCDKVCQNSMIIFLFILCVLKVCVNWDCVQLKGESTWEGAIFSHKERAWVCSGQYFIFNYTCMYTFREYSDYITEPCLYKFSCILLANDV